MLRWLPAALLVLAPLAVGLVDAQGDIKLAVEPGYLVVSPGSYLKVNLSIYNPTNRSMVVNLNSSTPNSTQILVSLATREVRLAAGAAQRVEVHAFVPNATLRGAQPIDFIVTEALSTSPTLRPFLANTTLDLRVEHFGGARPPPTTGDRLNATAPPTMALPAVTQAPPTHAATAAADLPSATPSPHVEAAAQVASPAGGKPPSTAFVFAGGVAAVGASAGIIVLLRKHRWPILLSVPLYTRLAKARILEQPVRERIALLVKEEPGITFSEIQRRLDLAAGSLTHHARMLEQAGVLFSSPDGQTRRFFHVGQGRVAPVPSLRERALLALSNGPRSLSALAEELGVTRQSLHYHVKKLAAEGKVIADESGSLVLVPEQATLTR